MAAEAMVVDSSIFIEHLRAKNQHDTTLANLPLNATLYVSAITVFELFSGATDANKYGKIQVLLQDILILPVTATVGEKAGEIFRKLRSAGQMIELADILIAATALANNLPVKTLNTRHFERIDGLQLA